jgi:tetratricopeptide (TPR) repeat protein
MSWESVARRTVLLPYWLQVSISIALALWLLLALLLIIPLTRRALAFLPVAAGQWCYQEGFGQCARNSWNLALALDPADSRPSLGLGAYYLSCGKVASAERHLEAARAKAPDSPEALNNLGLVYAHRQDHLRAIAAFKMAAELDPGKAAIEHNLGRSLQAAGAHEEALDHYKLALSLEAPRAATWTNMALIYYEQGNYDLAVEAAKQALNLEVEDATAYSVLGAVALAKEQPQKARANLLMASVLDPDDERIYSYLGLAYKTLGQPSAAVSAFERALDLAQTQVSRTQIRRYLNELYRPGN